MYHERRSWAEISAANIGFLHQDLGGAKLFASSIFRTSCCLSHRLMFAANGLTLIALIIIASGCGGGGAGGGGNQLAPSFNLSLSSSGLYISAANPGSVTVSVTGSDGFDSSVSIAFSSLPTGVSVSPSSASLTAGQSLQFMFSAASSVSTSSLSVSVKGNSGNQSQQVALNLQINADTGNVALPRTRYVRTDAVQPYTVLFDSGTNRFFMSDPGSNQIFAFDAGTRQLVGSIIVPGAYGMDEAPDHSVLYTGTQVGDVYAINPVTMAVTQRYPS